jgi:hypothetical protein
MKGKPRKQGSQACLAPAGLAPPRGRLRLRGGWCYSGRLCSPPSLPFSFSSGLRVGGQGIESPEAVRVGRALGSRRRLLIAVGSAGCAWTAGMCRMAAGCVMTAAMTGAAALWPFVVSQRGKREDDDDDVGVTQRGPHLAVSPGGAR